MLVNTCSVYMEVLKLSCLTCFCTGKSLGYGFVEFMHNREKSERARQQIDLKFIDSNVVRCQFVKDSILSFNQLNSRCLIADGMPKTFASKNAAHDFFTIFEHPYICEVCIKGYL